jgi:cyclophilin family peptidyl-prolyl cis-trans isomerase
VNESSLSISNLPYTVSVAHHDVPDCGDSEFFVNLEKNVHLDEAYGGYAVFARAKEGDDVTRGLCGEIARRVKGGELVQIIEMTVEG